jgi:hypothetical protein
METLALYDFILNNFKDIFAIVTVIITAIWNYYLWRIYRSNRSNISLTLHSKIIKETPKGRVIQISAELDNKSKIRERFSSIKFSVLGCTSPHKKYQSSEIFFNKKIIEDVNMFEPSWEWSWINPESKNYYKTIIFIPKEYVGIKIICRADYLKTKDDYFLADSLYLFF